MSYYCFRRVAVDAPTRKYVRSLVPSQDQTNVRTSLARARLQYMALSIMRANTAPRKKVDRGLCAEMASHSWRHFLSYTFARQSFRSSYRTKYKTMNDCMDQQIAIDLCARKKLGVRERMRTKNGDVRRAERATTTKQNKIDKIGRRNREINYSVGRRCRSARR